MKAQVTLDIYKTNAEEHTGLKRPQITVHSCGEYSGMVVLEIGDPATGIIYDIRKRNIGSQLTPMENELNKSALQRCTAVRAAVEGI